MPHIITYFGNMTGMDPTNAMERIREIASLPGELERPGIICVIGEPGVDRGTQCARLAKDLGASHLSVVDLLKEGASRLLVTHKIDVMAYMRVGKLVPKEAVQSVLEDGIIDSINAGKIRILLDGFPRSMDQTKLFETGEEIKAVLLFQWSRQTLLARVLSRTSTSGRVDDTEAMFKTRYQGFLDESTEIIDYFEKEGKLFRVDCDRPLGEIYEETMKMVKDVFPAKRNEGDGLDTVHEE